jgi:hypothetical protein
MASGSIRARNVDMQLPANLARIMTANATSLSQWLGDIKLEDPLRRKAICYVIKQRLVSAEWVAAQRTAAGGNPVNAEASVIMSARMQEALPLVIAAPAPMMGLFGCPRRQ